MSIDLARTVADAVLWEGYLLYPYRADSAKNQIRWQFGVLGPPLATGIGVGEDPTMHCECLVRIQGTPALSVTLRFLQLVHRQVQELIGADYVPVDQLQVGAQRMLSFDEAGARDLPFGPIPLQDLLLGSTFTLDIASAVDVEQLTDNGGRLVGRVSRARRTLSGTLHLSAEQISDAPGIVRVSCTVSNTHDRPVVDRDAATAVSFLGAHLLLEIVDGEFLSLLEPPADAEFAAAHCRQSRCWPVLAGSPGDPRVVLASPIILYDYPAVAPESAGALFDSTEIDEILTLRVMTLTDDEKAAARATDPAAAAIIDRCESMPMDTLARLHGTLRDPPGRDPHGRDPHGRDDLTGDLFGDDLDIPTFATPAPDQPPWWDPGVDGAISPTTDTVSIDGLDIGKGALVRIRPRRRADAQDLFYAGQLAEVTSVYSDVDGNTHVAVVLADDPAADLHEWYGRYLYFGPEEIEPAEPKAVRAHHVRIEEKK